MAKNKAPHHMHALTKGASQHLFNMGHLDAKTHKKIVAHAERGMAKNPRAPRSYEGSPEDMQEDTVGAKKSGMSMPAYENSSMDAAQDAAGQRRLKRGK